MLTREQMHSYQVDGVQFVLDRPKSALWLSMGLGKSTTALTAVRDLLDGLEVNKVLIIAPLRVANTVWHVEAKKWEHLQDTSFSICTGSTKERLAALARDVEVYVINRENVPWLVEHYGAKWPFDCVVIDEASSFKSSKTKRFKSLRKVNKFIKRMIQLTGTPAPAGLLDLWSQLFLIDSGERLGKSFTAYKDRFFESDFLGYSITPRKGAEDKIYNLVQDVTFSVDDVVHSNRIDIVRTAQLTTAQEKQYKQLEKDFILELESTDITAMNAAALSNKLMQYANGNVYDEEGNTQPIHRAKVDVLAEIREETDEPLLVAYNYKSDLAMLKEAFPDAVVLDKNLETVERWNRKEIPMLLAHPASASMGLNLQSGSSVLVWYGLTWSLEYYQQFVARLDRQGQTKTVRNIHIATEGTIDERVMLAIESKAKNQDELLQFIKNSYNRTHNP